ncbi:MAG: lysozyme [Actinomycetota bacterium]|nr:lysozyme [Actinomycetota bacterium]
MAPPRPPSPRPSRGAAQRAFRSFVGLVLPLLVVPATASTANATAGTIPGIDISQWQETIDWPSVDPTKVVFVIMRATKGKTYVDPSYSTNLAGASNEGFIVGAYHRATPSRVSGDAISEADHFLSVARNSAGDLIPALDIEETGGLSVNQLQDWVQTWVERVDSKLGVRSMVYASPYFWRTYMGDTHWFADHGYPLWIANWNVPAPDVPAGDWHARGWTYWQWSSTGSLHGIPTAVDRDRFNGTDLKTGQIASLTVALPQGGAVTGSGISCGAGSSRCTRLANAGDAFTLTATPDAGAVLLGWTGACAGAGTSGTCEVTVHGQNAAAAVFGYKVTVSVTGTGAGTVSSFPSGVDCPDACSAAYPAGSTINLTATADSASAFDGWSGGCSGLGSGCSLNVNGPRVVGATFTTTQRLEQDGVGTGYLWGAKGDGRALGGSYRTDHRVGASTTLAFRDGAVTLVTVTGPAMGKATIEVDGVGVGTINGYAPSAHYGVERRFDGFGPGAHSITVTATGTGSSKSTGTRVAVDAIKWGGVLHKDPRATSSTWSSVAQVSASGGSYVVSDVAGASSSLHFTGTGATLVTLRGPGMGMARLVVDGVSVGTVDLYAPTQTYAVQKTVAGLSDGSHVLTLVVAGTHRPSASGSAVAVDGWIIR